MCEANRNRREFCNLLFNVNEIYVRPCYIDEYIRFSHELDEYLCCKYSEFYAGLQLYQSKEDKCKFTVIAAYYEVPGICQEARKIVDEIGNIYESYWCGCLKRENVFTFLEQRRIS